MRVDADIDAVLLLRVRVDVDVGAVDETDVELEACVAALDARVVARLGAMTALACCALDELELVDVGMLGVCVCVL